MKTISGKPISTKPISLSKATKILSKFVSAENGASHVINVYLKRASSSFKELNQLHKDLNSPHSNRKHKKNRSETHDQKEKIKESSIEIVELNQEAAQSKNENIDENEEKPSQTVVELCQDPNDATEHHTEKEGGTEKHKKKKKKRDVEHLEEGGNGVEIVERKGEGELKTPTKAVNEDEENMVEREKQKKKKKKHGDEYRKNEVNDRVESEEGLNKGKPPRKAQESVTQSVESHKKLGDTGDDDNEGMEEEKKHKRDKKKKKDKDGVNNLADNKSEVGKTKDESATQKEYRKVLGNGLEVENGGIVDHQEPKSKKKKRYEAESEDKTNTNEVKKVQKKNEDVEGRAEDRSSEPRKKHKRKHGDA